uniref:Uncharacterized protein n=1 Tax=Anopheles dirus TaxID=7168 RepID=A0A182NXJ9_9DIPT
MCKFHTDGATADLALSEPRTAESRKTGGSNHQQR